jgi:membrane protease YdiL (CAAX protease family)
MDESNHGPDEGSAPMPAAEFVLGSPEHPADPATFERRISVLHGLRVWFGLIAGLGILSAIANMAELTMMVTLAAVFVSAQAADRDASFEKLRLALSAIFVIGASICFGLLAVYLANNGARTPVRIVAIGISYGGAVACLVTSWRPFADGLSHLFFRTSETSHTLRLGARVVLMILLLAVPGYVAAPLLLENLEEAQQPLLDAASTVSTLIGMTLLSLGAIGFLVKRDVRETLERLGLTRIRLRHVGVILGGVVALYLINLGSEWLQRLWFPDQWAHDQQINQMLAGGITMGGAILVGVGAGVGEELAMRGALQPKLGLVLTSIAFAALHVHYSWFGMAMIFVLGFALGWIRIRTSTSVSIVVHTLYDIVAVIATVGLPK